MDAVVFANDTMDLFLSDLAANIPDNGSGNLSNTLATLIDLEKHSAIRNAISPCVGNMFVTPKEIGEVVGWLSNIIANAINMAMHKGVDRSDINRFMY